MYSLSFRPKFLRKYRKYQKQASLRKKIDQTLELLSLDPRSPKLRSHNHKVFDSTGMPAFSSSVTNDIRIIWDYDHTVKQGYVLDIIDIGGHSGSSKVYI